MSAKRPTVLILGAGVAGLGAALRLLESGTCDVTIVEQDATPGGLARSVTQNGFTFDMGIHGFFPSKPGNEQYVEFMVDVVGADQCVSVSKKTSIFFGGRYLSYPLGMKELFSSLPWHTTLRCGVDFLLARLRLRLQGATEERSFKDWIVSRFGRGLYGIYFGPYVEKVWGVPGSELAADALVRRIVTVSVWSVITKAIRKAIRVAVDRRGEYSQQPVNFLYAKRGVGALPERLSERVRERGGEIQLGCRVERITVEHGRVTGVHVVKDGQSRVLTPDYVMSSLPLTTLARCVEDDDRPRLEPVQRAAAALSYRAMVIINLMLKHPVFADQWVYVPDTEILFNRINEYGNLGTEVMPEGCSAMNLEITCFKGDATWRLPDDEIFGRAMDSAQKLGFFTRGDVIDYFVVRLSHAYPVYDVDTAEHLRTVFDYLGAVENFSTIGRQGMFAYINMDEALGTGFDAASRLVATVRGR